MRCLKPPNVDEFGNVMLLRQAVDILAAEESVQRSLYPEDLDPSGEMALLFDDAWSRVKPVFEPILAPSMVQGLEAITHALTEQPVDWERIRSEAAQVRKGLPGRPNSRPRAWLDQLVHARNRLLLRSQL